MFSNGQQMKHTDERLTRMLPWRNFVHRQEVEKRERLVVFVFLVKKRQPRRCAKHTTRTTTTTANVKKWPLSLFSFD